MGATATVRRAILAAVAGAGGGAEAWRPSVFLPSLEGAELDGALHRSASVEIAETAPHAREGRQRAADGMLVQHTVLVRWAHRIRGDAVSSDYDAALDAEQQLVRALVAISVEHVLVSRLQRRLAPEGWLLGTITLSVTGRYALQ